MMAVEMQLDIPQVHHGTTNGTSHGTMFPRVVRSREVVGGALCPSF